MEMAEFLAPISGGSSTTDGRSSGGMTIQRPTKSQKRTTTRSSMETESETTVSLPGYPIMQLGSDAGGSELPSTVSSQLPNASGRAKLSRPLALHRVPTLVVTHAPTVATVSDQAGSSTDALSILSYTPLDGAPSVVTVSNTSLMGFTPETIDLD